MDPEQGQFLMVLSDGETYAELEGAAIVWVPRDASTEDPLKEATTVFTFGDTPPAGLADTNREPS